MLLKSQHTSSRHFSQLSCAASTKSQPIKSLYCIYIFPASVANASISMQCPPAFLHLDTKSTSFNSHIHITRDNGPQSLTTANQIRDDASHFIKSNRNIAIDWILLSSTAVIGILRSHDRPYTPLPWCGPRSILRMHSCHHHHHHIQSSAKSVICKPNMFSTSTHRL